jgi:hypothetical protein
MEALKGEIVILEQMNAIQEQEGAKTEETNQKFLEQIKGLEEENERLRQENKQKLEELEKKNKDLEERLEAKEMEFDFYTKEFLGTVGKQLEDKNEVLKKNIEEKDAIIAQKDKEINAQKRENLDLGDENFLPEFENKALKERPKNEGDGKKNSKDKKSEKLPKKPINLKTANEVDDFRKRLKELRGRYARNGDNYSLDDSRRGSVSYSQTFRKRIEDSDLPPEKYTESAMKSDKTFEGFDKTQQMSFADQHYLFGSVLKAVDEIREDDKEHMLPKLREIGQQMLDCLNSDYWKNDVMWDNGFETQNKSVKEAIRRLLEYIEKENKRTSWLQKSVTEKKLKTAKAETKTRSRFSLSTTATDTLTEDNSEVVQELNQKFNSENSGSKTKETELFYKKIDPKISSGKKKLKRK